MKNNIKVIHTRKYKDVNLYLRFSWTTTAKQRACSYILSRLMCEATTVHKTKESMQRVKDMLYGMSIDVSNRTRCDISSFDVHYSFINPKFVKEPIESYLSFIDETLHHVLINQKAVNEVKRSITSTLKRENDRPSFFAKERVIEIVGEEYEGFKNLSLIKPLLKDIKEVTVKDIKEFYEFLINSAQLNVYVMGDIDENLEKSLTDFNFEGRNKVNTGLVSKVFVDKGEFIDKKKMSQSVLARVYQTPIDKKSDDFFAWKIGDYFLGVAPCSLLFEEVREKRSLCYSISAIEYSYHGIVKIVTSIDASNKDTVLKQIDIQIKRIIDQDYDVKKLDMAKALFVNMLESISDDGDGYVDYLFESEISGFDPDIERYKKKIMEVTPDDLTRIFKQYKPYFTYMLEGTDHD